MILNVPSSLNVTRGLVGYGSRLTCASAIARSGRRIINDTAKFAEERGAYDLSNFQTVYHSPTSLQFRTGEPSGHPVAWTTWQQQAASTARVLLFIAPADRYLNEPARNARSSSPMSGPARARSHVERREARSKKSKSKSTMRRSKKGRGQRCRSRRSQSSNKFGKQNNLRNLQLNFRNRHFNSRSNRCVARCVQRHPEPTASDLI